MEAGPPALPVCSPPVALVARAPQVVGPELSLGGVFGECTGERAGIPGIPARQVFVGPTTLGVYRNYAVSAGVQYEF